SAVKLQNNEL
nr:Chain C, Nonstructural protein 8/9 [Severe acute respiratory syndrome coronavirus 2]7T9Y_D Chain D, Nonstructural protein 8/9 [Severe acute respiratory syndrome coronavirus 2]